MHLPCEERVGFPDVGNMQLTAVGQDVGGDACAPQELLLRYHLRDGREDGLIPSAEVG